MKCDHCGEGFKQEPTVKTIRGKQHTFCSEFCFVLHHLRMPVYDMSNCGGPRSVRIPVPDFKELLSEEE